MGLDSGQHRDQTKVRPDGIRDAQPWHCDEGAFVRSTEQPDQSPDDSLSFLPVKIGAIMMLGHSKISAKTAA